MIQRNVVKIGGSLAVLLPSELSELIGIEKGQTIYWNLVEGKLTINLKKNEN